MLSRCPKATCGVVIERSAGCNHIECSYCTSSFCYICGEEADPDSNHWFDCPRYGQPGDKDASYDEEYPPGSDEEDDYRSDSDEEDEYPSEPNEAYEAEDFSLQSFTWPGKMHFGKPFTIPGLNASPQEQLLHDLNIAMTFNHQFEAYVYEPQGRPRLIPDCILPLINRVIDLMYTMEDNMGIAWRDMTDDEPTTDAGREEQAMDFSNFRMNHDRLRNGFVDAYNAVLTLVKWNHMFFHMFRSIRFYRETLERYMILHAPRFLFILANREKSKDSQRLLRNDVGRWLDSTRREQPDDSEDDYDDIR